MQKEGCSMTQIMLISPLTEIALPGSLTNYEEESRRAKHKTV